jgi:multidrug efflux pump subunit AcrA (membrane-fusion protein)
VPLQAIYTKENQSFVYLYHNNEYKMTAVTLGQMSLSHVEILSGLKEGQEISLINQEQS